MEPKPVYIVRTWQNAQPIDRVIPDFYETLYALREEVERTEKLTNEEIANAAIAIAKLETVRKQIVGQRREFTDCADEVEYLRNLLAMILGEIDGVNYDHLPDDPTT